MKEVLSNYSEGLTIAIDVVDIINKTVLLRLTLKNGNENICHLEHGSRALSVGDTLCIDGFEVKMDLELSMR